MILSLSGITENWGNQSEVIRECIRYGTLGNFARGAPHPNSQDINSSTDPPHNSWEFLSSINFHLACTCLTCYTVEKPLLGNGKGIRRYLHACFARDFILLTSCRSRLLAGRFSPGVTPRHLPVQHYPRVPLITRYLQSLRSNHRAVLHLYSYNARVMSKCF